MKLVIGNYNYSSWSLRAWWAAVRSGVDFEIERIPLDLPDTKARIRAVSGAGRVPVLLDGDVTVWDSLAIAEYLAERSATPLWPEDARVRAWARSISAEMHSGFEAVRAELPMNIRASGRQVAWSDACARDLDRLRGLWTESLARHGGDGPWLCGSWSIADAMYAPVVLRVLTYGVAMPELVWPWLEAVRDDADIRLWSERAAAEDEVIDVEEVGE